MTTPISLEVPEWMEPVYQTPWRFLVPYGGRGGTKTESIGRFLLTEGYRKPLEIICGREFQNSMEESVKGTLEEVIEQCNWHWFWDIQANKILGRNGSVFRFKGLARNIMSIKSWHNADYFWGEEANTISKESLELLLPTIRKPGSRIIFTLNRHKRTDPVDKMFIQPATPPAGSLVIKVGYRDNPWFPAELEAERQRCLKDEPERYPHIWEGEPDDAPQGKVILPYGWLTECVDAHIKCGIEISGTKHAGLDAADGGKDNWAYVARQGSLITNYWEMPGEADDVCPKAHAHAMMDGVTRMYYDAIGVGAAVKPAIGKYTNRSYVIDAFKNSNKVRGENTRFVHKITNKDQFANYGAQCWWNLRLRVLNTRRLLRGEKVNPERCLFFDSTIDGIDSLLLQMSQAIWDYDGSNKIKIQKAPDDKESPNAADAAVMAFAFDLKKGLKQ